jgi:hypothetical protein
VSFLEQENITVETMVPQRYKSEAEEVTRFMEGLDQSGKEKFLEFIRGAKFALNLVKTQKSAMT